MVLNLLSRALFLLPESSRYQPYRMGDQTIIDANIEGHRSASGLPYKHIKHMGDTAELVVEKFGITREEQDQFAFDSQMKAKAAERSFFSPEIVPVSIPGRKGTVTTVELDGHPNQIPHLKVWLH